MENQHESTIITYSSKESLKARGELFESLKTYKATPGEIERSLGLFIRGSLLARIFAIREMYEKIVCLPGCIMDIGTWRGQTAVICENLRAIFEPLHLNRRIICFDTFEGYAGFSEKDKETNLHKNGTYNVEDNYSQFLEYILQLHEKNNAMGHNYGKHKVIKGDCRIEVKKFFNDFSNEFVSLAFFDVNSYDPTQKCFQMVYERLVPGGIICFWQLTRDAITAEGTVYNQEINGKLPHTLKRSQFYPGLCYLEKK